METIRFILDLGRHDFDGLRVLFILTQTVGPLLEFTLAVVAIMLARVTADAIMTSAGSYVLHLKLN